MSYKTEVLTDAPVAFYRLDEGSGASTMLDSSGHGRDGTYNNGAVPSATSLLTSDSDKALTLDGVDDYASVAAAAWMQLTNAWTCEFWCKPSTISGDHIVVGRVDYGFPFGNTNWSFGFHQTNNQLTLNFFYDNSANYIPLTYTGLVAGGVYHVVGTYDGTTIRLYINGTQVTSAAHTGTLNTAPGMNFTLGSCHNNDTPSRFVGTIDEVALYGSVLSATRVAAHYAVGTATVTAASGALSGSGTLEAATTQIQTATGALTGSGSLSGSGGTALVAGSGALSGSGTLSASGVAISGGGGPRTFRLGALATQDVGLPQADLSATLLLTAGVEEPVETASDALLTVSGPDVLKGTSGSERIDLTGGAITLHFRPTEAGVFKGLVTHGSDTWFGQIIYRDSDGDDVASAPDNVAWAAFDAMRIRIIPAGPADQVVATFVWEYDTAPDDGSPTGAIVIGSDTPLLVDAPGAIPVDVANGVPGEQVTFSLTGNGVNYASLFHSHLDDDGMVSVDLPIPKVDAGLYSVTVTTQHSGSAELTIVIEHDPLDDSNEGLPEDHLFPPPTNGQRWTFIDRQDPTVTHTMARNPSKWSNPNPPNQFTHDSAVAPNGQILTWQAARRAYPMEFAGYIDTEAEYAALQFWADRRRRFWLIDHRNRAWVVTFEQLDARARIVPNKPWAHDYTVKAVVFRRYD